MNIRIEDLLSEVVRDYERKEQQCWKSNAIRKMSDYCTEEELVFCLFLINRKLNRDAVVRVSFNENPLKYSLNDMVMALSHAQKTQSSANISTSTTSSLNDLQSISIKQDLPSVKIETRQRKFRRKASTRDLRKSDPYYKYHFNRGFF